MNAHQLNYLQEPAVSSGNTITDTIHKAAESTNRRDIAIVTIVALAVIVIVALEFKRYQSRPLLPTISAPPARQSPTANDIASAAEAKAQAAEAKLLACEAKLQATEAKLNTAETELAQTKELLRVANAQGKKDTEDLARIRGQRKSLRTEHAKVKEELTALRAQVAALQQEKQRAARDSEELARLKASCKTQATQISESDRACERLQQELKTAQHESQKLRGQVQSLTTQSDAAAKEKRSLEHQLAQASDRPVVTEEDSRWLRLAKKLLNGTDVGKLEKLSPAQLLGLNSYLRSDSLNNL